jgi:hypothetical protein
MPYTVRTPAFRGCMGGAIEDAHTRRVILRAEYKAARLAEESECPDAGISTSLGETACQALSLRGAASPHDNTPLAPAPDSPPEASVAERAPSPEPEPPAAHDEVETPLVEAPAPPSPERTEPEPAASQADENMLQDEDPPENVDAGVNQTQEEPMAEVADEEPAPPPPAEAEVRGTEAVADRPVPEREEAPRTVHRPSSSSQRPAKYDHVKSRLHHVTAACRAKKKSNDKVSPSALTWSGPVVAAHAQGEESRNPPKGFPFETLLKLREERFASDGSQSGAAVLKFRAVDCGHIPTKTLTKTFQPAGELHRPCTRGSQALFLASYTSEPPSVASAVASPSIGSQDPVFPLLPKGTQAPVHMSNFSRLASFAPPSPRTFSAQKPRFGLAKGGYSGSGRMDTESFLREILLERGSAPGSVTVPSSSFTRHRGLV